MGLSEDDATLSLSVILSARSPAAALGSLSPRRRDALLRTGLITTPELAEPLLAQFQNSPALLPAAIEHLPAALARIPQPSVPRFLAALDMALVAYARMDGSSACVLRTAAENFAQGALPAARSLPALLAAVRVAMAPGNSHDGLDEDIALCASQWIDAVLNRSRGDSWASGPEVAVIVAAMHDAPTAAASVDVVADGVERATVSMASWSKDQALALVKGCVALVCKYAADERENEHSAAAARKRVRPGEAPPSSVWASLTRLVLERIPAVLFTDALCLLEVAATGKAQVADKVLSVLENMLLGHSRSDDQTDMTYGAYFTARDVALLVCLQRDTGVMLVAGRKWAGNRALLILSKIMKSPLIYFHLSNSTGSSNESVDSILNQVIGEAVCLPGMEARASIMVEMASHWICGSNGGSLAEKQNQTKAAGILFANLYIHYQSARGNIISFIFGSTMESGHTLKIKSAIVSVFEDLVNAHPRILVRDQTRLQNWIPYLDQAHPRLARRMAVSLGNLSLSIPSFRDYFLIKLRKMSSSRSLHQRSIAMAGLVAMLAGSSTTEENEEVIDALTANLVKCPFQIKALLYRELSAKFLGWPQSSWSGLRCSPALSRLADRILRDLQKMNGVDHFDLERAFRTTSNDAKDRIQLEPVPELLRLCWTVCQRSRASDAVLVGKVLSDISDLGVVLSTTCTPAIGGNDHLHNLAIPLVETAIDVCLLSHQDHFRNLLVPLVKVYSVLIARKSGVLQRNRQGKETDSQTTARQATDRRIAGHNLFDELSHDSISICQISASHILEIIGYVLDDSDKSPFCGVSKGNHRITLAIPMMEALRSQALSVIDGSLSDTTWLMDGLLSTCRAVMSSSPWHTSKGPFHEENGKTKPISLLQMRAESLATLADLIRSNPFLCLSKPALWVELREWPVTNPKTSLVFSDTLRFSSQLETAVGFLRFLELEMNSETGTSRDIFVALLLMFAESLKFCIVAERDEGETIAVVEDAAVAFLRELVMVHEIGDSKMLKATLEVLFLASDRTRATKICGELFQGCRWACKNALDVTSQVGRKRSIGYFEVEDIEFGLRLERFRESEEIRARAEAAKNAPLGDVLRVNETCRKLVLRCALEYLASIPCPTRLDSFDKTEWTSIWLKDGVRAISMLMKGVEPTEGEDRASTDVDIGRKIGGLVFSLCVRWVTFASKICRTWIKIAASPDQRIKCDERGLISSIDFVCEIVQVLGFGKENSVMAFANLFHIPVEKSVAAKIRMTFEEFESWVSRAADTTGDLASLPYHIRIYRVFVALEESVKDQLCENGGIPETESTRHGRNERPGYHRQTRRAGQIQEKPLTSTSGRASTTMRSRNRYVDRVLQEPGQRDGNDNYADLEDFISDDDMTKESSADGTVRQRSNARSALGQREPVQSGAARNAELHTDAMSSGVMIGETPGRFYAVSSGGMTTRDICDVDAQRRVRWGLDDRSNESVVDPTSSRNERRRDTVWQASIDGEDECEDCSSQDDSIGNGDESDTRSGSTSARSPSSLDEPYRKQRQPCPR